ncbi:nitric-oxide reductase large subunit [Cytobacillus solani]|uniref:nitric-oxide reductase large subunit n=1 Tax=Cytobacillus solani TaxID=1637975 RepID=UPI00207A3E6E|nr:nitric-oxide reductase large subunit [Cytobacillus solani]USK56216.1 nitric-oxide reductase large subunit [Cytobacillus solani]
MEYKKLWLILASVFIGSFIVLLYFGGEIYQKKPPIPNQVVTESGDVVFAKEDIQDGQKVWQRIGGNEVGSIWGHGAYVAPDWTADWLHRSSIWILDTWAQEQYGNDYQSLSEEKQASLKAHLKKEIRTNTYNPETENITISEIRSKSISHMSGYYASVFGDDPALDEYREKIAIPANTVSNDEDMKKLNAFFWWATWSVETNRPGEDITYSNNWPGEPLIDNVPTSSNIIWSVTSIVILIAGIGALVWYYAFQRKVDLIIAPKIDPLLSIKQTPSMKATIKYFWVVTALLVLQIILGVITAHYAVEGNGFYGIPLNEWFPYSVTRTWHQQIGIFWIATAWLATGLYIGPAITGHEPKFQKFGVNFLFVALLVVVLGSMAGEWAAVKGYITNPTGNFYFGHQGYEYVDLGRMWQILLTIGLFLWFFLMARAIWPALKKKGENRHLLILFLLASVAIPVFYVPGLMWGETAHLSMVTYWRWWVVHLWVEGFFEVFAVAVLAFIFTRMGLVGTKIATTSVLLSTSIFLFGGILGTFHHLYFAGTPVGVLAVGASFSALEVVPLALIGYEAFENYRHSFAKPWMRRYKWPIMFFVSVSFWNLLGAGVFGFLINPPISLYYIQGLNTTPLHAHTALFGVYGMLGIGLMLFCLRGLSGKRPWKTKLLRFSFWALNIGLLLMAFTSLLPVGILQAIASIEHGMWYARSAEFLNQKIIHNLVYFRSVGDTIFALGVMGIAWFVISLKTGKAFVQNEEDSSVKNNTTDTFF